MKRGLLTIGLLLSGMTMMAQEVFNFGFETPPSELNVGKLEYVNFLPGDSLSLVTSEAHTGTTALMLQNVNTSAGNNYQRALKFRNLPFEANTSYRVSFWVKAPNTYTLAGSTTSTATTIRTRLEVGTENHDVNIVGANNTSYDYNFTGFDPSKWVRKTAMFYYSSDDVQKAYYKKLNPDSADLENKYFLNFNVFNPGTYYIDDVSMVKSSIKGITYNNDVIKVDFGYTINADALRTGKDYETAVLPASCVTVTKDGVPVDVEAVEIQKTGFYIFLTSEYLDDSAQGKIKITFNNPGMLKYTDALRPGAWDANSDQKVLSFTNENADYDMNLTAAATLYAAPFLKSITPENESFDLPLSATTFKVVYSKKVDCALAKAVLAGPAGSLNLQIAETGFSDTLTYSLPSDKAVINGDYVLTISGLTSENGTPAESKTVLSYSYGPSAGGKTDTVFADAWYKHRTAGVIPTGWRFTSKEGAPREGGSSQGSGPRLFYFSPNGNFGEGMYMRTNQPDTARFTYGTYADNRLHIKPGKHKLSFYAIGWKSVAENSLRVVLKDTLGNIVLDKPVVHTNNISGSGASVVVSTATLNEFSVLIPSESDYIIEIQTIGNWTERVVGKFTMLSVPSTAALYKNMLTTAITQANAALLLADSSVYNCTAKTDLKSKVEFYSTVAYTAPSDYTKASGIINQATTLLGTHKANVDAYFTSVSNAAAKVTSYTGTKFANLDAFPKLVTIKGLYDKLDPVVVDESVLKMASDSMNYYSTLMTNWATTSVPALTFRLNKAIALAQKLKVPVPAEDLVAAQAALTDDETLVAALNAKIKQYLYHNIAIDSLHFGNSLESASYTDSIELTNYVKNPNLYTSYTTNLLDNGTFPGWVTSGLTDFTTGAKITNAGINTMASATTPVVDTYGQSLNNKLEYFEQTVTGLPAGIYNIDMKMRKGNVPAGTTKADVIGSQYAYVIAGKDTMKIDPWITQYPELPGVLIGVKNIKVPDNGSFKMGFYIGSYPGYTPTITWGDPQIWLVGKNDDFVYTHVKPVVAKGEVKEVQYFTIQGIRVNRPVQGLNIVKTIYDNGTVDVQKVIYKF